MGDREALLRAVCENPDADLPRLVFADWLEEHGEPERAEFIRAMIEAKRATKASSRRTSSKSRASKLVMENGKKWRAELPGSRGWDWGSYSRGFIERLQLTSEADPLSEADIRQLFASVPVIDLQLCTHHSARPFLPHLGRVRRLFLFAPDLTDDDIRALCDPAYLGRINEVVIWFRPGFANRAGVRALIKRFGKKLMIGD